MPFEFHVATIGSDDADGSEDRPFRTIKQAADLAKTEPKLTVVKLDITKPDDLARLDQWDLDVFVAAHQPARTGVAATPHFGRR